MDGQMGGRQEGGGEECMEGRRRGRGVTHFVEPGVFIEESVLIGEPLGERQPCTGTLLLVLHLLNLIISQSCLFLVPPSSLSFWKLHHSFLGHSWVLLFHISDLFLILPPPHFTPPSSFYCLCSDFNLSSLVSPPRQPFATPFLCPFPSSWPLSYIFLLSSLGESAFA